MCIVSLCGFIRCYEYKNLYLSLFNCKSFKNQINDVPIIIVLDEDYFWDKTYFNQFLAIKRTYVNVQW